MQSGKPRRILIPQAAVIPCYRPWLTAQQRTQIFFGGAGSGKSVFLASRALLDALTGRSTLVVRQVARTLRVSCFNETLKAMARLGLQGCFDVSRSEMSLTCRLNGAQLLFLGLDDVEKIKSLTPRTGVLTDIWVEEATECRYGDIKQLEKRLRGLSRHTKRLSLSFNPVHRGHWLYRQYFTAWQEGGQVLESPDLLILRTNYLDNPFLSEDDRRAYAGEKDPYFHRVYTLGEWGELAGSILTNWRAQDLGMMQQDPKRLRFGLDFGFAKDPCAALKLQLSPDGQTIYALEELCLRGLSNQALAQRLVPLAGAAPVICDSAEPKSIAELRSLGIRAFPARKGPDSLRHGISWLQPRTLVCDNSCRMLMAELQNYRWKEDAGGQALPIPEGDDHLIDALRYALEPDMQSRYAQASGKLG